MQEESAFPIPVFQVQGSSYGEIGYQVGKHFRDRIQRSHQDRKEWGEKLLTFAHADRRSRFDPFLQALQEELPHLVEELQGLAEGAEIHFDRLFVVALNPELSAMMQRSPGTKGCTTAAVAHEEKLWIAHNEDGNCAYHDDMYLLDLAWPSGSRSWCFCYPGYFPGNGPSVNSAGLAQTVNYIGARTVKPGLPRYAIDRAIMEAKNLSAAIALATHPRRAYSQHHVLLSLSEKRIVGVETSPDRFALHEVNGIYVHANHYLLPEMKSVPEFDLYQGTSLPRQRVAEEWSKKFPDPGQVTPQDLHSLLSNHENYPLSICRHPAPQFTGCTLGGVLLLASEKQIRFFANQPCHNQRQHFPWPG